MGATTRKVHQAAREVAPWIEWLARAGYLARGVVYLIVALLAGMAAFQHRRPSGARGAFHALFGQPLGRALLPVLALGLFGYAAWRLVQAVIDPERKGTGLKGIGKRLGYVGTAAVYLGMAWSAIRLSLGWRERGDRFSAAEWTRPVMAHALGRWLIVAVGAGIVAYGLWLFYRSVMKEPEKRLDVSSLSPGTQRTFKLAGRIGIAARAVVFEVVGVWMIRSALHYRPEESRMPAGALESVREQPHGRWLLALMAVGLAAFGLFELVKARFRRIQVVP
jgi:hypothetical protein